MPDSIVMTMYNRPHYSRAVLDALSRCAGIKNYLIVICVEPGNEAVLRIAKSVNFAESKVYVNPERYGCSRNSYEAMRRGFENSEFVIYVQDDDQLAYDALKYFEFCKNKFRGDGSVYTVCAWNLMKDPCPPSHNHRIMRRDLFISLTMATWKDRWEERGGMRDNWDYGYKQGGWDVHINEHLRKGRWEVYPWLSRLGLRCVLWSIQPEGLRPRTPDVQAAYVLERAHPGAIVDLHDAPGLPGAPARTCAALPAILDGLRQGGYALVSVSRLLAAGP